MILLDTHAALWVEIAPERLSLRVRARLHDAEEAGEPIAISCMTLWEIAYKNAQNRLELFVPCDEFLKELANDFLILPIDRHIANSAAGFPDPFPRDLMDRLITATALVNDLTLITVDEKIHKASLCKLLW